MRVQSLIVHSVVADTHLENKCATATGEGSARDSSTLRILCSSCIPICEASEEGYIQMIFDLMII